VVHLAVYGRSKAYVSFQVRIRPDLKEQLVRKSYETGISQGAIVSAALKHYLASGLDPRTEPQEEDETEENH